MVVYYNMPNTTQDTRKRPTRILLGVTKSNYGGAQRYAYDLATSLPKDEYEVKVAFGSSGEQVGGAGVLSEKLRKSSIPTAHIPSLGRDYAPLSDIRSAIALWKIITKYKPDLLHLNSPKMGGLGALVGKLRGIPTIYTAHGFAYLEKVSLLSRAARYVLSWITVLFAKKTITVSRYDARHAPLGLRSRTSYISNGITPPTLPTKSEARKTLTERYHIPSDHTLIGTIGEHTKNKGLDVLLYALAALPERVRANLHCLLIGEGEDTEKLQQLVGELSLNECVTFAGYLPDASAVLPGLDIFAFPSRKEGLPYTIIEAGFAGLPVVATKAGGVPELLLYGDAGYLCEVDDIEGFKEILEEALFDTEKSTRFGKKLQESVHTHNTLEKMLESTQALYRSALGRELGSG